MPINDNDVFLINSGGTSYSIQAEFLADASGTVLVNRDGVSYKASVSDLSDDLKNTDLLLVNRTVNGVKNSFKVSGAQVLDYIATTPVVPILIPDLTWTSSPTKNGSSPIEESTFYDGNNNTGAVMTPSGGDAYLNIDFTQTNRYWKATHVIYGSWSNQIANGNWTGNYRGNSFTESYRKQDGGNQNATQTIVIQDQFASVRIELAKGNNVRYHTNLRLKKTTSPPEMAAAIFEIYGIEVNVQGTPI